MYYCVNCNQIFETPEHYIDKCSRGLCQGCAHDPDVSVCRCCITKFTSRNKLFKHLNKKPLHKIDQPQNLSLDFDIPYRDECIPMSTSYIGGSFCAEVMFWCTGLTIGAVSAIFVGIWIRI